MQNEPDERLVVEAGTVKPVDLNLASAEELEALQGIGPELTRRIIAYRDTKGPFLSVDELLAVPGIGSVLLSRIAGNLTVASEEGQVLDYASEEEVPLASEVKVEDVPAEPEVPVGPPVLEWADRAPVEEEGPVDQGAMYEVLEEEPASLAEAQPMQTEAPEEAPTDLAEAEPMQTEAPEEEQAPPHQAPPAGEAARPGRFQWLWGALLGGLLGVVATLLILWALNGSLALSRTPVILDMDGRVAGLSTELGDLQGELSQMQERLQVLESLPGRMDNLEGEVAEFGKTVAELEQQTKALQSQVVEVEKGLTAVRERTTRVETFFEGLQALLADVFGQPAKP